MELPVVLPPVTVDTVVWEGGSNNNSDKYKEKRDEVDDSEEQQLEFKECANDTLIQNKLRDVIKDYPNATAECDGSVDSAWNNSLLLSAKLKALNSMVPKQSRQQYEKHYNGFKDWCCEHGLRVSQTDCVTILTWLEMMSGQYKLSSLWSKLSGIKCMLLYYHSIDSTAWKPKIAQYMREKAKKVRQKTKKAAVFDGCEVERVWKLNDEHWLNEKFAFAIGYFGGLRKQTYTSITHKDIKIMIGLCVFCNLVVLLCYVLCCVFCMWCVYMKTLRVAF